MSDTNMSVETFENLAEIHGGDIARWPEARRAEALALVSVSSPARSALEAARALDAALDALAAEAPPPAPAALRARMLDDADRILRAAPAAPGADIIRPVFGRARLAGPMALAASAMIGVFMGWSAPSNLAAPFMSSSAAAPASEGESFMSADLMPSDDPFAE